MNKKKLNAYKFEVVLIKWNGKDDVERIHEYFVIEKNMSSGIDKLLEFLKESGERTGYISSCNFLGPAII